MMNTKTGCDLQQLCEGIEKNLPDLKRLLIQKIRDRSAVIGVIGMGYVGLPLVREFLKAGFSVTGFDTDRRKVEKINDGRSYIKHIDAQFLTDFVKKEKKLKATTDFSNLANSDCIVICVPTPLNANREPDMKYVFNSTKTIARFLRKGQLIALESTTYPGTTDGDMRAMLETTGLKAGSDFFLAYSPEREDPNNGQYSTSTIAKVVGGYTADCLEVAKTLYDSIVERTVPVSSTRVAESSKLLENIYRAVNIALVNELKMLFDRMGIDVWEVIEASKTKPFGFQAFYPGPGLGGHCIPIDPFYLTWKAREYDFSTRFIELAGEINSHMPYYVIERVNSVLNEKGKTLNGARILVLGVAYKKDVDDQRESPSLKVISLLKARGADVCYNDPFVDRCAGHRHFSNIDMKSSALEENALRSADLVLLLTDHSCYDYNFIETHAACIVDTRGAFRMKGIRSGKIYAA